MAQRAGTNIATDMAATAADFKNVFIFILHLLGWLISAALPVRVSRTIVQRMARSNTLS